MSLTADDKKKLMIAVPVAVIALGVLGWELLPFLSGPPQPAVRTGSSLTTSTRAGTAQGRAAEGGAAAKVVSTSTDLDPTLHEEGMLAAEAVVYMGTGRNIFATGPVATAPVQVVANKFPPRPTAPPPTSISTRPALPAINLKFFGTATQNGVRRALLLSGDDVFLAGNGDIVQRRYRVVSIATNSILVEDLPNSNQQTLPLIAN